MQPPRPPVPNQLPAPPSLWRRPSLWLALVLASLLHVLVFEPPAWLLPERQTQLSKRPRLWAQLLPPAAPPAASTAEAADSPDQQTASAAAAAPTTAILSTTAAEVATASQPPSAAPTEQIAPAEASTDAPPPTPAETAQEPSASLDTMQAPESVLLQYQLSLSTDGSTSKRGQAELRWHNLAGSHYTLSWQQNWSDGKVQRQQSTGQLGLAGLEPERYSEKSSISSERATHFVAEQQRIIFSSTSRTTALQAGQQDPLSLYLQLGGLLAVQMETQSLGRYVELPVANLQNNSTWRFHLLGFETPRAPVSPQEQWLKLQRTGQQEWEPTITLWYSTEGYLPMRIERRYPAGQVQLAELSGVSPLQTPPSSSPLPQD